MEEFTRLVLCDNCRKSVPITDIKYVPRTGRLSPVPMCYKCRETGIAVMRKDMSKRFQGPAPQKKVYLCSNCRYKFRFNPVSPAMPKCPLCGSVRDITEYRETFTSELLNSLDGRDEF